MSTYPDHQNILETVAEETGNASNISAIPASPDTAIDLIPLLNLLSTCLTNSELVQEALTSSTVTPVTQPSAVSNMVTPSVSTVSQLPGKT